MESIRNCGRLMRLGALALALGGLPAPVHASEGYFSYAWGTRSKGLAGASLAYVQDSLSGAANPAAIAFLGRRFDVGVSAFMPYRHFTATTPSGGMFPLAPGRVDSDSNFFPCAAMGVTSPSKDGLTGFGLLLYGNGGMNTQYPGNVFGAGTAGVNLEQIFVSPTVARKFGESTSVGLGLIFCEQIFKAEGLANFAQMSSDPNNLTNRGDDHSTGFGLRLGALHKIDEKLSVAAAWQPRISMTRFKKYAGLFAEQGKFDIPETYSVGIAYQSSPGDVWTLDVRTIRYSDVPAVANPFASQGLLGSDNGPGFGWRDMTVVKVGHEWSAQGWTWRLGASHGRQPIPGSEVLFNILAPGVQEWEFAAGFTHPIGKGELSGALMFSPEAKVSGANPMAPSQNITIGMHQYDLELGYSLKF